jgi:hypothetical protein
MATERRETAARTRDAPSPPTRTPIGSIPPRTTAASMPARFGSRPGGRMSIANGETTSARMLAYPTRHPIWRRKMAAELSARPRGPRVRSMSSS